MYLTQKPDDSKPKVSGGSLECVPSTQAGDKFQKCKSKVQSMCGSEYKDYARKIYTIHVESLASGPKLCPHYLWRETLWQIHLIIRKKFMQLKERKKQNDYMTQIASSTWHKVCMIVNKGLKMLKTIKPRKMIHSSKMIFCEIMFPLQYKHCRLAQSCWNC